MLRQFLKLEYMHRALNDQPSIVPDPSLKSPAKQIKVFLHLRVQEK